MTQNSYFCNECLKVMSKKHCDIELSHADIGDFTVVNVLHYACNTCGDRIVPRIQAERIEIEETKLRVLNSLGEINILTYYDLCEGLNLDIRLLNKAAEQLENEGKVFVDMTKKLPEVTLIREPEKGWLGKLTGLLK